jgi:hypothetical protein
VKAIDGSAEYQIEEHYKLPKLEGSFDISFLYSDSLEDIESGAKSLGRSSEVLALVTGMAILRIERDGLWSQAGFHNLREYRIAQKDRLGLAGSTITYYRRLAGAWIDYRKVLARIPMDGRISKLVYLPAAMERYQDTKTVLDHFKRDSWEEFKRYARPDLDRPGLSPVDFTLTPSGALVNGKPVLLWPDTLPELDRDWLGGILGRAYQARAGGNLAHVVEVYDQGEARAVDNFLKKLRAAR